MLGFLDWLLLAVHLVLVGFNLTGWIWKRTRKVHLWIIGTTMLCWFGLGLFFGFGYCPITDWQWQIKHEMGETGIPGSCVKYYVDKVTGWDSNTLLMDLLVAGLGLVAFGLSVLLNWRDRRRGPLVNDPLP